MPRPRTSGRTRAVARASDPLPAFVEPELATLVDRAPRGPGWIHEVKYDGYRLIARIERGHVQLFTRSGLDWTAKFISIADELAKLPVKTAMLDGEAVVLLPDGRSSFGALQQALSEGRHERIQLFLFDLLFLDGRDWRPRPLVERRAALAALLDRAQAGGRIRFSHAFEEDGPDVLREACKLGLEGIISKPRDARYRSGRARAWLKIKCKRGQEFVIGGYQPSDKQGRAFRSLLLGTYEGDRLVYAGQVGTGFTVASAADLLARMKPLRRATPALEDVPREDRRRAVWIEPKLVCNVEFTERTSDGKLRHPAFKGLREDKPPAEVHLDRSEPMAGATSPSTRQGTATRGRSRRPPSH